MGYAADPGHRPFDAQSETGVHEGPILPKVQIPPVSLGVEPLFLDSTEQLVVVVFPLRAADNLSVPFRSQTVVIEHRSGIIGIFLHVEGLHLLGVVINEDRPIVFPGQERLVVSSQVAAPGDIGPQRVQPGDGFSIGDPGEGRPHSLERIGIALQLFQLFPAAIQGAADDVTDKFFLESHVGI
jgi:hypothetical protein